MEHRRVTFRKNAEGTDLGGGVTLETVRYESFAIVDVNPDGFMQGTTDEGKTREFGLVVNRDVETGELSLGVCRHYTDPDSLAAFAGSEPWQPDEVGEEDA